MSDFISVKVTSKTKDLTVKIEKGCSFENNGSIYRVDEDGNLNVYDKKNRTWSKGSKINMNDYQIQAFLAVANNYDEKLKDTKSGSVVLSKKDIDMAMEQHKTSKLKGDLSEFLAGNYEVGDAKRYSNYNAVTAYVTNGNPSTSANLVFKYGSADEAVNLSDIINKVKEAAKSIIKTPDKLEQKTAKKTEEKTAEKTVEKKTTNKAEEKKVEKQPAKTEAKDTEKPTKSVLERLVEKFTTKSEEKSDKTSATKNNNSKVYYDRSKTTPIPNAYKVGLRLVAKQMGLTTEELDNKIAEIAEETGYSEYFIKHIMSMEKFEPKVRDTKDTTVTGGFGHTALKDKTLKKGQTVSANQAFEWLVEDIKFFEKQVKSMKLAPDKSETIGDYFDELPLSVREAIIDLAFNRGPSKLESAEEFRSLRANIKAGEENLPATVVRLCQDFSKYSVKEREKHRFTAGLMWRNTYRFLLGIRDLNDDYRACARRRFEKYDDYYNTTITLKKERGDTADVIDLQKTWKDFFN